MPNAQKYGKIFLFLSQSISVGECAILRMKLHERNSDMKSSDHITASQKLSECCTALCRYQLQKEYDTTLSLYDEETAAAPICSHHAKGSVRVPLWKVLLLFGACAAFCALIHGLCSLFSD